MNVGNLWPFPAHSICVWLWIVFYLHQAKTLATFLAAAPMLDITTMLVSSVNVSFTVPAREDQNVTQ
jgi:hypothetical protein